MSLIVMRSHPILLQFCATIFISCEDLNYSHQAAVDLRCAWEIRNISSPRKTKKSVWKTETSILKLDREV